MSLKVSVIIPTRDRANYLPVVLRTLLAQDFPTHYFEVLIIDNGSSDQTEEVSRQWVGTAKESAISIRYFFEPVPGLLSARHRGAKEAKGSILTFIDDDIKADPGWLRAIVSAFENPLVHLVGGRNLPEYETPPPEWSRRFINNFSDSEWECVSLSLVDLGLTKKFVHPTLVMGLNFSIRKKTLFELGGFHPDIVPRELRGFQGDGETGLSQKIFKNGYLTLYEPKALVFHVIPETRLTQKYFEDRQYYQGVCDSFSSSRKLRKNSLKLNLIGKMKSLMLSVVPSVTNKISRNKRFSRAYWSGFRFHQDQFRKNKSVRSWVLKEDFFDYRYGPFKTEAKVTKSR